MRRSRFLVVAATLTVAVVGSGSMSAVATRANRAASATSVSGAINVTADQFADNEETLGMDPTGTLLAGSWNDFDFNDGCGFSYSTDGGSTWAPRTFVPGFTAFTNDPNVPGTGTFDIAGDPSVAYNPAFGTFDVICQAFGTKTGNQIQMLATTFDPAKADPNAGENASYGPAAWTAPVAITTGTSNGSQKGSNGQLPDHESIAVDTGHGGHHHFGRLYVTWAEFSGFGRSPIDVAFSDDNGGTWTGPIRVSDAGHQFDQDARPAVGPDGTVFVTWINGPNENSLKNNTVMAAKSTDGGSTWSKSFTAAAVAVPIPGTLPNSKYRVFEDAWPAVNQASGKLVVAYTDEVSGPANIYAAHTTGAGTLSSWSSRVAIKASPREEFFPWVSAAPNGRVDVVFYDRTCDTANVKNCVTLASTTDSGSTWSSTAITHKGFDGDKFQSCVAFLDPPNCGFFFLGDYIAVASTNAAAHLLYTGNGPQAMDVFSQAAGF